MIVGIALVPLNYLSHMVELEDHVTVLNYWAETVGFLNVELRPCDREGDEERVDMLQDPMEMVQYENNHWGISHWLSSGLGSDSKPSLS